MISIQMSPEIARALVRLIETASRKGKKSEWWAELSGPLVSPGRSGPSFLEDLQRSVKP